MAIRCHPWPPLLFFLLHFLSPLLTLAISDSDALLKLKESFENATLLDSWGPNSDPCTEKASWVGVICFHGIITGLRLGRMGLSGKIDIDVLLNFPGLRSISFIDNSFTGPIPGFNRIGVLKAIYISGNKFSGEIPPDYFSKMASLKKIWLDRNAFEGPIPTSVSKLSRLMELHLENNQFSGSIPPSISLPLLRSFNVSNNELEGSIPTSLSKFDASAFAGNPGLCGTQMGNQCESTEDTDHAAPTPAGNEKTTNVMAVCVVIVFFVLLVVAILRRAKQRRSGEFNTLDRDIRQVAEDEGVVMRRDSRQKESVRKESSVRKVPRQAPMGELVLVNEDKGSFGLTDLMKAAAEVLGAGGLGSAYKAVMTSGVAVVVKRMREMDRVGNDGFEVEMRRLGRLRHPNILPLLAFHSRKEEKLLVYDFAPRGSLLYLLHGDRGEDHAELNWPTRLKIISGIARGMAHLHVELANLDLPHGNLRSSNVLLRPDFEPMIGDYGFFPLVSPMVAAQSLFAYKSPEYAQYSHISPKSDVYCFGILILEIITGKFPSQYLSHGKGGTDVVEWVTTAVSEHRESQLYDPEILGPNGPRAGMERLVHLGATCADPDPTRRPTIREAAMRIEEIVAEEGVYSAQSSMRGARNGGGVSVDNMDDVYIDQDRR